MPGGLQLLACGWSNHTPWQTPREESEDELYARLDALAKQVSDPRRAVFMIHVPPHDSGLDTAPILDENLRPDDLGRRRPARARSAPPRCAGSSRTTSRSLAIHGHIHESGGERKIGKTLCINPGSEANHGILRGYLIDIGTQGHRARPARRGLGECRRSASRRPPAPARSATSPSTGTYSSTVWATLAPSGSNPGGP